MSRVCQCLLVLLTLAFGGARAFAASPAEDRVFTNAVNTFLLGFWNPAEKDFEDFTIKYPQSARLPEAVLYQAEARLKLKQFAGSIDLLSANQANAGKWTDQYLYWIAEAHFESSNYTAAANAFSELIQKFPRSSNSLDAAIGEATARARLQEWPRVVALLQQADGAFQQSARGGSTNELSARGYLLLGEAQLAQKNFGGADAALQWLIKQTLNAELNWRRQYLQCRLQLAQGAIEDALQSSTNLLVLADAPARPDFQAESAAFQAGVFERLNRFDDAIADYTNNLAPSAPAEQQRQALLKIAELYRAQGKISDAIQILEKFPTNSEAADTALLTLGELQLKQYLTGSETNRANPDTNLLQRAEAQFDMLLGQFTNSPLTGKALLDKGWCLWVDGKIPQSAEAFQLAAGRLPFSGDQAEARFKWADAQFATTNFGGAIANYEFVISNYASLPEAKEQLFERALYQIGRAALESGDINSATNALQKVLEHYPNGFLLPEVRLAIAQTFELQKDWDNAIAQYESWLNQFTKHAERPRAEYYRAWDNFMAGRETNAMTIFTNLIAQFPTNQFAPLAQWWIADHFFRQGAFQDAENYYQVLFQNTNWQSSPLIYQARMMAGRAAVARLGYSDAIAYFTNKDLTINPNCPTTLKVQARFAYGDALMNLDTGETNRNSNLELARSVFSTIPQWYGTNQQTVLAWGKIGDCNLQLKQYDNAATNYQQLIASPEASVAARSQAEIGLGIVSEKQAEQKEALGHYIRVFNGNNLRDNETSDPFWVKEAGMQAGRLAEILEEWKPAVKVYKRLGELLPTEQDKVGKEIQKIIKEHPEAGQN